MSKEFTEPAFPVPGLHHDADFNGMSLRDYFAAKALAGLAANQSMIDSNDSKAVRYLADCSYQIADAMLIARVKP